jgi:glycosyltransferase involved in cell wall biosynthesis
MRIGIDAAWACGKRTGTGNYTYDLVRGLLDTSAEHEFVLYFRDCCVKDNPLYAQAEGRAHRRILSSSSTLWRLLFKLGPAAQKDRVDLLLSPGYFLPAFAGSVWRIVTIFDLNIFKLEREWIRPKRIKDFLCLRLLLPLAVRHAEHLVVISESTRRDLEALFPSTHNRNTMIYPGVSGKRFGFTEAVSVTPSAPVQAPYFLYVGVMSPTKNLVRLIQAFGQFRSMTPSNLRLVMAGRECGVYRKEVLIPLVRQLNLESQVEFVDFVADNVLGRLYQGARAVVYPSLGEGFGYPLVESMLAGTPVITSTTTSCPEVVGSAGLCVDPLSVEALANAMKRIAMDDRLHADLRNAGYQRARLFSLETMVGHYLKLFNELDQERKAT